MMNSSMRAKLTAAILLLPGMLLSGCGSGGGSGSGSDSVQIGVSFYTKTIPLYSQMEKGMKEKAEQLGVNVDFSYSNNSARTQVDQINSFITRGVDVILASPVDTEALVPAYEQAQEAGIPILSVANQVGREYEDAYISPNLVKIAKETMDKVIKGIGGSGELLLLTGPPQIAFVQKQKKGWKQSLDEHPDVSVVETLVIPDMTTGKAVDVATNGLSSNSDVDAVVSSTDDISLGAIQAAKSLGFSMDGTFFAGWDGSPAGIDAIRAGEYDLTMSMRGKTWGEDAIETAVDYVHGDKPDQHNVITPYVLIDQENIDSLSKKDMS